MLGSVIKVNKKHYPQTLLEENLINDDLDPNSSDEFDSESDSKSDDENDNESNA